MYDKVVDAFLGERINYGIIDGNSTILLIKGGQGSSIYGYDDKYLRMAMAVNSKYGITVIVASNKEFDGSDSLKTMMNLIGEYSKERGFDRYQVYYMGHSNGALLGSWYSYRYPEIKRLLLVNTPIKARNYQYIIGGLEASKAEITFVYGKNDYSYPYISLLNPLFLKENVHFEELEDTDHHFTEKISEFILLPEKYLL